MKKNNTVKIRSGIDAMFSEGTFIRFLWNLLCMGLMGGLLPLLATR